MSTHPEPTPPAVLNLPDRWNKPKMAAFLRELACTHSIATAAKAVGMSRQSAYKLRNRLKGEPFDIAWEAAFQHGYDALHQAALERALHGIEVPVFHGGQQVGTRRHFDERLTTFLLSARNRSGAQQLSRYRAAADFYTERWDELLGHVEEADARWPREEAGAEAEDEAEDDEGLTPEEVAEERAQARQLRERTAVSHAERYTAPDPRPGRRGA